MEEKNTVIGNISTIEVGDQFGIKSENSPFVESFYFTEVYNDKSIKLFIKSVERLIRTSYEYKTYIELLRTNIYALNHDSIMSNITTADVDLEFHHYPLTLYDIIYICMNYHLINKENFTSFSLAKEVMNCHYRHIIGLVPLTKTTHELAHSGNLFLSSKQIFGDYSKFINEYAAGVTPELKQKIDLMEQMSEANVPTDFKRLIQ